MRIQIRDKSELTKFIKCRTEEDDLFISDGKLYTVDEMIDAMWAELRNSGKARLILDDEIITFEMHSH